MIGAQRAWVAAGAGLMATALSVAAMVPAQAAAAPGWRIVSSQHFGTAGDFNGLLSVVSTGRDSAWAFGGTDLAGAASGGPLAEHWNGRSWRAVTLPSGLAGPIDAASAPTANDIWAVGAVGGYALHYNGSKWSVAKRWKESRTLPRELTGVTAFSPTNVWVFGGAGADPGLGTWHLHGSTWTKVTGIGGNIATASALSSRNIWAIGGNATAPQNIVLHYNGSTWQQVKSKALDGVQLSDILALSPGNVWVAGVTNGSKPGALLLHLRGTTWTRVKIPFPVLPVQLAPDGTGGLWMTGVSIASPGGWRALHLSRAGAWQRYVIPRATIVVGLAHVPGTASLWATGTVVTTRPNAAIWAYGPVG